MALTTAIGVIGSTIKLFTGGYYDVASPRACDVHIEDIAHVLSNICRFGGHIPRYYSVAEHSVQCYRKAVLESQPWPVRFATLMHDATEAYVGDVVKPLKLLLAPIYGPLEDANERAIAERFGIDFAATKPEWKRIDLEVFFAERNAIFGSDGQKWTGEDLIAPYSIEPQFHSPNEARDEFLRCFESCQRVLSR